MKNATVKKKVDRFERAVELFEKTLTEPKMKRGELNRRIESYNVSAAILALAARAVDEVASLGTCFSVHRAAPLGDIPVYFTDSAACRIGEQKQSLFWYRGLHCKR